MKEPSALANMTELRAEIDRIDRALVELLVHRAACIDRAVVLKRQSGLPARIEPRVAEVLANVRRIAEAAALDPALAEDLWRQIVEWSIRREERELAGSEGQG